MISLKESWHDARYHCKDKMSCGAFACSAATSQVRRSSAWAALVSVSWRDWLHLLYLGRGIPQHQQGLNHSRSWWRVTGNPGMMSDVRRGSWLLGKSFSAWWRTELVCNCCKILKNGPQYTVNIWTIQPDDQFVSKLQLSRNIKSRQSKRKKNLKKSQKFDRWLIFHKTYL